MVASITSVLTRALAISRTWRGLAMITRIACCLNDDVIVMRQRSRERHKMLACRANSPEPHDIRAIQTNISAYAKTR